MGRYKIIDQALPNLASGKIVVKSTFLFHQQHSFRVQDRLSAIARFTASSSRVNGIIAISERLLISLMNHEVRISFI